MNSLLLFAVLGVLLVIILSRDSFMKKFYTSSTLVILGILSLGIVISILYPFTTDGNAAPANTHMTVLFTSYPNRIEVLAGGSQEDISKKGLDSILVHYNSDEQCAVWNFNGRITIAIVRNGIMQKYEFGQNVLLSDGSLFDMSYALIFNNTPALCVTP